MSNPSKQDSPNCGKCGYPYTGGACGCPPNPSAVEPFEYKVVLKMEDVEETDPELRRMKAAGLALPPELKQKEQQGGQRGVVIAIGGNAFEDWKGRAPKVGDRVYTARYPGFQFTGEDGQQYRMVNDKDLCGVIVKYTKPAAA